MILLSRFLWDTSMLCSMFQGLCQCPYFWVVIGCMLQILLSWIFHWHPLAENRFECLVVIISSLFHLWCLLWCQVVIQDICIFPSIFSTSLYVIPFSFAFIYMQAFCVQHSRYLSFNLTDFWLIWSQEWNIIKIIWVDSDLVYILINYKGCPERLVIVNNRNWQVVSVLTAKARCWIHRRANRQSPWHILCL